jgi:3-hydroxyisobutyrate dehydrogenase-like beta-hydroxyacid dehydrogenase
MEKLVQSFGGHYIDGAILAWPSQIGHEETTILASGEPAVFEQIQGILSSLAGNLTFMGADIAASSALFSAVLSYLAGEWIGFCHGALICEKEGLDVKSFGTLMHTLSPVLGAELAHMGQVIADDDFYKPESTLKTTGGDLVRLLQHSHEAGINDELPKFASSMFAKAIAAGYGGEEHAALIKVLR